MRSLQSLVLVIALTGALCAQASTLAANFDATTNALTRTLTGAPAGSPTMIFMARAQGSTPVFNNLFVLDLDGLIRVERLGMTDANGDLTEVDMLNPRRLPPAGTTVYFQAATVDTTSLTPPTPPTRPTTPPGGMRPGRPGRPGMPTRPMTPPTRPNPSNLTFVLSNVASVTF